MEIMEVIGGFVDKVEGMFGEGLDVGDDRQALR